MARNISVLCTFLMLVLPASMQSGSDKSREMEHVVDALKRITDLASTSSSGENLADDASLIAAIDQIIAALDATELSTLAILSWAIHYPGDAKDVRFDEVFYKACWRCISRLCATPTAGNLDALLLVEKRCKFGGAERMAIDEKIEALRGALNRSRAGSK